MKNFQRAYNHREQGRWYRTGSSYCKIHDRVDGRKYPGRKYAGAGTKFTVDISFDTASEEDVYRNQISEQPDALKRMEGKRILLAEDNDLNAEIAIELLAEQKIIADRAMDGADCLDKLEKAASGYYDMILMDIQMPVMDGYDATARIRRMKDEEKASIPIIAMTANAFAEDRQKAISTGMNDHVAKPIDMKVLLPVMAKYIR